MALTIMNMPIFYLKKDRIISLIYNQCSDCKEQSVPVIAFGEIDKRGEVFICEKCILKYFTSFNNNKSVKAIDL